MTPPATARVRPAPAGPAPALRAHPQSTPRPRRAPAITPRLPRRVSGPDRLRRAAGPALALSELPLLDRLIKGRAWIGLVAFALIGIVTMQLALLEMNAGIGRALVHEAALERENSALSVEASEAEAADTIEQQAGQLGMQLVAPGTLRFLSAQGGEGAVARAVAALNADAARAGAGSTSEGSAGGTSGGSPGSSSESSEGAAGEASASATGEASSASATGEASSTGATGEASSALAGASGEPTVGASTVGAGETAAAGSGEAAAPQTPATAPGGAGEAAAPQARAGAGAAGEAETGSG
jgi:cell division protein FtsL